MNQNSKYAAAIPAYQAEPYLGKVIQETIPIIPFVLVVDDGSTDNTSEIAEKYGAQVFRLKKNQGKGRALQVAFIQLFNLGFEKIITLDADGQHDPAEIPKLIAASDKADMVIGSRENLFSEMKPVRKFSNKISSNLISILAGKKLLDIQSGFRLYSKTLISVTGFPEPRFEAESAVIVRAVRRGFNIASVPISLQISNGLPTSHFRPVIDSLRIANGVFQARLESVS